MNSNSAQKQSSSKTSINMIDSQLISDTVEALKKGESILYPTETVWGLGCDATNQAAVQKITEIKARAEGKSFLILLADEHQLNRYVKDIPEVCWDIIDSAVDPITLIYPEGINLAQGVCAEDGSIGIRITSDPFCKAIIKKLNRPILSTSANLSNHPTPNMFNEISDSIKQQVDYIVNLPAHKMSGKSSSVIKVGLNGSFKIIRK
jgi:L-threonylcarbamoyladenylate synthase